MNSATHDNNAQPVQNEPDFYEINVSVTNQQDNSAYNELDESMMYVSIDDDINRPIVCLRRGNVRFSENTHNDSAYNDLDDTMMYEDIATVPAADHEDTNYQDPQLVLQQRSSRYMAEFYD